MQHSLYIGCYLLHSYLTCSLEIKHMNPYASKPFGKIAWNIYSCKEVLKNKVTDTLITKTLF